MNESKRLAAKWQEDEALRRFRMISPLMQEGLDDAHKLQLRAQIAVNNGISTRTLYRYEKTWRENEFQGLKPQDREKHRRQGLPDNFDELLEQAIQLKKEVPKRSVNQIIAILELEHRVAPGVLKRSTLERHLYQAGYGRKQLQMYMDARESSSKRFCKPHRMMLVQADIKYGIKLPIGKNGAMVQTYLSSAIDDHSRFLLSSRFYDNQEETIVEDTFHRAIDRFGRFDSCYVDNGSQYVARQLRFSLARLGIPIRFAPPRSGKSKGKVEKFHQVVDAFLREARLQKIKSLDELNHYWDIYVDEYYHKLPHDGIKEYYNSFGTDVNVPVDSLYESPAMQEIIGRLSFVAKKQLFAVVTADPGCGKSTLIRRLAEELPQNDYILLYLSDSKLTPRWFYKGLLDQLGIDAKFYRGDSKRILQQQIEIIRGVQKKKVVCVLDEAHLLEKETLEEFRFLLNYHFDSTSPMALVLVGQTELWDDKLKLQRYAAIRQRIEVFCTLPHLDRAETERYIQSHLKYAGCQQDLFTDSATDVIYKASSGIPRIINRVCDKSLTYAFQKQKRLVDDHMVQYVLDHEILTVS